MYWAFLYSGEIEGTHHDRYYDIVHSGPVWSNNCQHSKISLGTSLVVQWIRLELRMQGAHVRSPVRELDPTRVPQLSSLPATKTRRNQTNK